MKKSIFLSLTILAALAMPACSSSYKAQNYAKYSNSRQFEYEYPMVWKGTLNALGEYKIDKKDSGEGEILTDWIYSTSNDKYLEYLVNGFPRKRYLQTRYKFDIKVEKQIGSVKVTINPQEEIENLKSDGSFESWKSVSDYDTGRVNELLDNINRQILSIPDALNK